ncbi:Phage terminase, large subunit GpA [Lacrimispora sphenoides]|uniref:terminase gpA endonuclease subunit n=1 Tax=Lacrimispora sphenoides TaxID=29370 RepID=UPI0008B3F027|nr:terminase gpA endonuclease subunit [Lacrimispora sphenoides]SEU24260.1 Phage terminase, large subunit GpA [Lacrimispora sphenoides]
MSRGARERKKTANLFRRVIRKSLKKSEELTVSQWAEKYRILDESSNLSGRWSNDVTPYLIGIMNALNDDYIREIYLCKGSQLGGTEVLINMLMYIIDKSPAPTMVVYPSDDLAKDISNDKLKPAFNLVPQIKRVFMENASKELRLKFKTMVLYLRGAGSPSKLASKAIKYLFFDEIDKIGGASKKEASPYNLAMERVKTYKSQSKVYACSTPTLATNHIWKLHDEADEVKHYYVPCPHCGEMIELLWEQIKFDKDEEKRLSPYDRAKTARYVCQKCGCFIEDKDKPKMLREGHWQTVKKRGIGRPKTLGFWISSLYSRFLTWADIAEEFIKSKDDPELLQNFVNSWLGEPWEDTKLKTSSELVLERQTDLPEMIIPEWAKLITAGVDVQETSLYYSVRAWGDFTTSQNITHGQVLSFADIESIMNTEWNTQDGRKMIVNLALIDSGYQPDDTYDFCVNNSDWALPCKGASNPMRDRYKISKVDKANSKAFGMQLVLIDGGQFKDSIMARMQRENGTGSWMVYKGCDEEYASQVTSEHKVMVKAANGAKRIQWVLKKSHGDNHYLDCEVYNMAAAEILGVRRLHLEGDTEQQQNPTENTEYTPEETWIEQQENWI